MIRDYLINDRVIGIGLIADPTRRAGTPYAWNNTPNGTTEGVAVTLDTASTIGAPTPELPAELRDVTAAYVNPVAVADSWFELKSISYVLPSV